MIRVHLLNGEFRERELDSFATVKTSLEGARTRLAEMPLAAIIGLLTQMGRQVAKDTAFLSLPGVGYIPLWMRKTQLEKICRLNYLADHCFEDFAAVEPGLMLRAQPRGIVCHWTAGTTLTLSFFSLVLGLLAKNVNALKVPTASVPVILALLKHLGETEFEVSGTTYRGTDVVGAVAVVDFPSRDIDLSTQFSRIADVKIIWGGGEAVRTVTALPQQEHCEVISFGPKYSFAVFDRELIASSGFDTALEAAVKDVAVFNQQACSSPHVFFFEGDKDSPEPLEEIAKRLAELFEALPDRLLEPLDQATAARVINARGMHLLDPQRNAVVSEGLRWTILINETTEGLEEPVQGRCIFIKRVASLEQVLPEITRKVQAIGTAIANEEKRLQFATAATTRGADRIVPVGKMHDFDLPWDGVLALNRLVRWVLLRT